MRNPQDRQTDRQKKSILCVKKNERKKSLKAEENFIKQVAIYFKNKINYFIYKMALEILNNCCNC